MRNHAAVVRFALRGPGKAGPRPVSAPLADPTAIPALEHLADADAALRHVVHALLVGVEAKQVAAQHALQVRRWPARGAGAGGMRAGGGGSVRWKPSLLPRLRRCGMYQHRMVGSSSTRSPAIVIVSCSASPRGPRSTVQWP